jgi:hypothetical protein
MLRQQTLRQFLYDAPMAIPRPFAILGTGYTGRYIWQLAAQRSSPVLASSRQPEKHLADVQAESRIQFDLANPASWPTLPPDIDLIWTFPAAPLEQVEAWAVRYAHPPRRLVVLGSTSAYEVGGGHVEGRDSWIDETCPLNGHLPRVQGEEYLRRHHGAIVLRVAGIYGPCRNPVEWIRKGLVGPTDKFVNLIHVEDLAELCLLALETGQTGETYNVSDGQPRRWKDICAEVSRRWGIVSAKPASGSTPGKRILNRKLIDHFAYSLRHPNLYEALETLQYLSPSSLGAIATRDVHPLR